MKRILGIDVARALAVFGMILVNFKVVFGSKGSDWLESATHLFDGKAAATFVVLAGIGLALMTNTAYIENDIEKQKKTTKRILKRAILLFIIGLSYMSLWPADILHFYGIYMLFTLGIIYHKPKYILYWCLGCILLYPLLMAGFNYESGWDFNTLAYLDFWTTKGFIRNLFFNGFHPVFPWTAFMFYGLWYGRQDLKNTGFLKKSLWIGAFVFIGIQVLSQGLLSLLSNGDSSLLAELTPILGTDPMPPLPFYMVNGISIATVVISFCILISKKYAHTKWILALNKTGQLALTFYVAHVLIGMGSIEVFGDKSFGNYSLLFSVSYALVFSLACIAFSVFWLKHKQYGPLEWVIRCFDFAQQP